MGKVPQYTQDAINTYRAKFDIIQINFSKGTKERIKALGVPISKYVNELVQADLQRLENAQTATQAPTKDTRTEQEKADDFRRLNEYIKSRQAENEQNRLDRAEVLRSQAEMM